MPGGGAGVEDGAGPAPSSAGQRVTTVPMRSPRMARVMLPGRSRPNTIIVTPYDKSAMSGIETALRDSDLGVNPTNNGDNLRVVLPALTEERRKDYVKLARTKAEDGRVAVRGSRGNAKKAIEKLVKDKEIGEDEGTRAEKELEALTKKYIEQIDESLGAKETELETI